MLNIAKLVNDYLVSLPDFPVQVICNDIWPDEKDGIICRYDPSPAAEKRFIDGSRQGVQNFTYYARSKNATKCREWLQLIIDNLDLKQIEVSSGTTIECEAVTLAQFISVDDKHTAFYMASVSVEYTQEARENLYG